MAAKCPNIAAWGSSWIEQAHTYYLNRADQFYGMISQNLAVLDDILPTKVPFNFHFNAPQPLTTFVRPLTPNLNESDFALRPVGNVSAPPSFVANPITPTAPPPDNHLAPPLLTFIPKPDKPNVTVPALPPDPAPLHFPNAPTYALPPVPTFEQLQLPALPVITLPEFTATLPTLIEPPFNEDWTFTPTAYTSTLKDLLYTTIEGMLKVNRTALPDAIEAAIFQKGRSRQEIQTRREVETALNEFASRGFNLPHGMLTAQVREIRQRGQDRMAEYNRDAVIKQYEETLQNLRLALAQGAALEGVYINLHIEQQRFALEAARHVRESAMTVLQYRLTVFQARMEGYKIQAQVLEQRIRAELAKVELFRAQLEGERVRGEINQQRVKLYAEQLRSIGLLADVYKTQVEAVKVQADTQRLVFERYKTAMDGYDSRWRAYAAEMQGYGTSISAETARVDIFKAMNEAHAKRVDAWHSGEQMKLEHERLRIQQYGQQLQAWQGHIALRSSDIELEKTRLGAVSTLAGAKTQLYGAQADVAKAESAANDRSFELVLASNKAQLEADIKRAELHLQQARALVDQMISINETKAKVGTQLISSAYSAVNYSAGISSSSSQSQNCSTSFSFSGDIGEA